MIETSNVRNGGIDMDTIALILSIIGCINWGLVGLFRFDLVAWLFGGQGSLFSRLVYTLVGLAGLWCVTFLFRRNAVTNGD
jgi:uncharacterized membrane protein YuzA (DUF378 family)